jgi:RNA polymerase subunit RPABC4/transcription elongation factor Spt4
MKNCIHCKKEISDDAKFCSHCGKGQENKIGFLGWVGIIFGILIAFSVISNILSTQEPTTSSQKNIDSTKQAFQKAIEETVVKNISWYKEYGIAYHTFKITNKNKEYPVSFAKIKFTYFAPNGLVLNAHIFESNYVIKPLKSKIFKNVRIGFISDQVEKCGIQVIEVI